MSSFSHVLELRVNKNGFVGMPLLSHIEENLYVGMSPVYWQGGHEDFQTIFNFYPWEDYNQFQGQTIHRHFLQDSSELPELLFLHNRADEINEALLKGPVLVHCQMGVNRSNLFAAAALARAGRSIDDSIELLRQKRSPYVLLNQHFEAFLRESFK